MKMIILIVLYKKGVHESETIQSLIKCVKAGDPYKIVVWDNSPFPLSDTDLSLLSNSFNFFEYKHTPDNISLAKIYNATIKENIDCEMLLLFDHDSEITSNYFDLLKSAIDQYPEVNLFLPIVKQGIQVVSPGDFVFIKGKYWRMEKFGLIKSKNKLAIASGMSLRMSYLLSNAFGGFDERLKLYGIDNQFMFHYQKSNANFFVLNYVLKHSLSQYEKEDLDTKIKRYRDHKYSLRIIMKSTTILQFLTLELVLLIRSVYLTIKNRNINFLK